ncbi:4a-hydroxytetrahydrobiopterin dehydratase [Patescibacteria group bacterium AH-259-L07]|nr:4a-hydroxytetrahydrobiopterin dehydratase [Patescibacteria group bacterium AH-259-L07]
MTTKFTQKHCVPCEGGVPPMSSEEAKRALGQVSGWKLIGNTKIKKLFTFNNFKQAMKFVNSVAELAEREGHHPDIFITYNKVWFELTTHAINGLSENDFIMAAKIDQLD